MVTIFPQFFFKNFFQEYFTFPKNGQKKCPKMKIPKKSWKIKKYSILYNKLKTLLKETTPINLIQI